MKKFICVVCLLFIGSTAYGYEPAITEQVTGKKELNCKETVFVSGTPTTLEGTLAFTQSGKGEALTESYTYKLENDDGDSVSRQLSFSITSIEKPNGQVSKVWELTKFTESIVIGGTTYALQKYNFSRNELDDVKPVGTYFAGNINISKEYSDGTDKGKIKVEGTGSTYGYDTAWAKNETINMIYTVANIPEDGSGWTGKYTTTTSNTDKKAITYIENRPTEISFDGGFMMSESNISSLRYVSEMPEFYGEKSLGYVIKENGSYKYESFPLEIRLPNYALKGIKGHWGELAIRKAFALEYMDEWNDSTTPNTGVTRGEFAKIVALALKLDTEEKKINSTNKKTDVTETQVYKDVPSTNPYYKYIKVLTEKGVVKGTGNSRFQPNAIISRAEAITMIINALGFENKAPEPLPILSFNDTEDIPEWSEKFIYTANKIGLINGDDNGNVMARKQLTKAEIATIINNMVTYLIEDLGEEYLL